MGVFEIGLALVTVAGFAGVLYLILAGERVGKVVCPMVRGGGSLGITVMRLPPEPGEEPRVRVRFGVSMSSSFVTWTAAEAIEIADALERGAGIVARRIQP